MRSTLVAITALVLCGAGVPAARAERTCVRRSIPVCEDQKKNPPPPGSLDGVSPERRAIVEAAVAEIGIVSESIGEDCHKQGWQRLVHYYEVALNRPLKREERLKIKRARVNKDDVVKVSDWCGIFALFAVKAGIAANGGERTEGPPACATESGAAQCKEILERKIELAHWVNSVGPTGLVRHSGTAGMQPGDIAYFTGDLNHQAVVERVIGNRVYTIDGNADCQMVLRLSHPLKEVLGYYSYD